MSIGQQIGFMNPDCDMVADLNNYIAAHGCKNLGELMDYMKVYELNIIMVGLGIMLVYPEYDGIFDTGIRARFLELCEQDHFGMQMMLFTFPTGLPEHFYNTPLDPQLHAQFAENPESFSNVRHFQLDPYG
jgi:hypothetical protein